MVAFHKEFRVSPTIAVESMFRNKIPAAPTMRPVTGNVPSAAANQLFNVAPAQRCDVSESLSDVQTKKDYAFSPVISSLKSSRSDLPNLPI
jgi:hypothetical protein